MKLFGRRTTLDLPSFDNGLPRDFAAVLAAAGVPRFRDALPRMEMEFERARRYGRSIAVALAGPEQNGGHADTGSSASPDHVRPNESAPQSGPLFAALLGSLIRELMRETDIVAYAAVLDRCTVVMPEIGGAEARLAARRIRDVCTNRLAVPIRTEIAVFPHDGLTLEELLKLADAR
ncbi:MAG TPA: hypothetical protein VNK41_12500, partial [Vicinamibacterales bacterium]|nr:hypothetical protein [Vicinamibacterales bacterium]